MACGRRRNCASHDERAWLCAHAFHRWSLLARGLWNRLTKRSSVFTRCSGLLAQHLRDGDPLLDGMTEERLLQGPFSDAMTHAGQLALLRRLAGAPVPPENFIVAEIKPDRLGSESGRASQPRQGVARSTTWMESSWPQKGTKSTQTKSNEKDTRFNRATHCMQCSRQLAFAQDEFKPKTVFLIRHAEKEDEPRQDPPLKKEGVARSQELARLLGGAGIKAIFTSQFTRTKQTAEPLATKLGLTATSISLKSNPTNPRLIAEESTTEVVNKILERAGENVARHRAQQLDSRRDQDARRRRCSDHRRAKVRRSVYRHCLRQRQSKSGATEVRRRVKLTRFSAPLRVRDCRL